MKKGAVADTGAESKDLTSADVPVFDSAKSEKIRGDTTNNGIVDIAVVVLTAAYIGDPSKNTISERGMSDADVHDTENGINANDALAIQQYLAEIIKSLPV